MPMPARLLSVARRRGAPGGAWPLPTSAGLGFSVGVGLYFLQPALPSASWIAGAMLAALVLAMLPDRRARILAALCFGLLWAHVRACAVLCEPLPEGLKRAALVADGTIASIPDVDNGRARFLFRIERLTTEAGAPIAFEGLTRLSWYDDAPVLVAGERWRLTLRLKPAHGFVNPGGFDYERWLFEQGIAATGHVRGGLGEENRRLSRDSGAYRLTRWRQQLRDRIDAAVAEGPGRGLVQALVLGERGALTSAQWEVFALTGTSHLIAISGLHVGLVAGFVFFLARWLWARAGNLALRLAAPRAGALAALVAAAGYAALAGFAIPTQRALIMLAVVLVAVAAGRVVRPAAGLVLALTAVLALDPTSVLSFGFWLSFGAVAVLLYALGRRAGASTLLAGWGRAQWAVALGLLPMLFLFFGRASVVAPLVNLVAVPLFGLLLPVVLGAALVTLASGWAWPLAQVASLLASAYDVLAWIASWPAAAAALGGRPVWVWAAATLGILLLLAPRGLPARCNGAVLLLPLALARPPGPAAGEAWITLLDVGQGLSAVIRTTRHTLVYDTGPGFRSGFETGSAVVRPYLRHLGVDRLDVLVISHADQDHAGGLDGVRSGLRIARILSGEPAELGLPEDTRCRAGQGWTWDGVAFEILHPDRPELTGNDASCVLRVGAGTDSLLLPGDVEQGAETGLVERLGDRLRTDVLVAAHHGSATSSSEAFLRRVDPSLVLYSAGYGNRFGFPVASVRERVSRLGAASINTAEDGAVSLVLGRAGGLAAPVRERSAQARVWRHRPAAEAP